MVLIRAVADTTILVPGYEHQDWQCSICLDIEHRFVFTRRKRVPQPTAELLKANAPTTKQTDVAQASTESGELPRAEVLVHPTQPEPREANNPMRAQTDVEERGATRSTSPQGSAVCLPSASQDLPVQLAATETAKGDIAKGTQTDPEEHGATPSNSEQATQPVQPTPNSAPLESQQGTAPDERRVPASAWARAVAKLRNWQTEKG